LKLFPPHGQVQLQNRSSLVYLGTRARILEYSQVIGTATSTTISVLCACEDPVATTCQTQLVFTTDDLFNAEEPPFWELYNAGEVLEGVYNEAVVQASLLIEILDDSGSRRILNEFSAELFGSNFFPLVLNETMTPTTPQTTHA